MSNKLYRESIRQFNQLNATPSYEDLGKVKPGQKNKKYQTTKPLPINHIFCDKCHKPGGQLIAVFGTGHNTKYRHNDCNK